MSFLLDLFIHQKQYQNATVLNDVSLQIEAGEIVSLVGPSGCGKSTLLRLIAGLDHQYKGDIFFAGLRLHDSIQDIGMVFQEPRLLPWLTVAKNVSFGADAGAAGQNVDLLRVNELLGEVGLRHAADLLPKQLSGGMAQRAAIARGLFRQPKLLLLDEPFSAVDFLTRMRLQDLLLRLATEHQLTVLMVTHDVDEAAYLSDRVVVMGQGSLLSEIRIHRPHPRDRNDPALLRARNEILQPLEALHAV
jgi:sulfonate transport system ATP-binding protein